MPQQHPMTLEPSPPFLIAPNSQSQFLGRYLMPLLGHVPCPLPAGSVATNCPFCTLPLTLNEYHAWFSAPRLQPRITAPPVTLVSAAWISAASYVWSYDGVMPALASAWYVSNPCTAEVSKESHIWEGETEGWGGIP